MSQLFGRQNNNALLQATPHTTDTFLKFGDKLQAVRSGTGHAPSTCHQANDWCHAVVVTTLFGRGGSSRGHGVANEVVSARSNSHVLAKGMRRQSSSVPDRHGQCISVRRFAACITEVRHRFAVAEETVAGSCLLKSDVMRRRSSSKSSPVS